MNYLLSISYRLALGAILLFIALPILVVVIASISPTPTVSLQPSDWTLSWYGKLWVARWIEPFYLSVKIAAAVAILSGALGFLAAYAVAYDRCPGHNFIMPFLLSPLSVPQIVKGVAIVLFLSSAGLYQLLGWPGLIAGHVVLTLPFTTRMVATSIFNFNRNLDRAARSLGASKWQRVRYVLFPLVKPGLFSGMTLAFIISFNDVPLSLFLVRPGQTTLPITVINFFEYSLDPILAAVNVASLVFVLVAIFLFEKLGGFSAEIHGGSK
jgi:putative spermidine/putrescine transport system permease protein